jgi:hypothetical protein
LLKAIRLINPYHLYYCDTDSVLIKVIDKEYTFPVPLTNRLGGLANELAKYGPGSYITEFISAGCKNYAYRFYNQKENKHDTVVKIRGFPLTYSASQDLNFDVMKSMVLAMNCEDVVPIINPQKIINKQNYILTTEQVKKYRLVHGKRQILADLTTLPWGY